MSKNEETIVIGAEDETLALQHIPESSSVISTMEAIKEFQNIVAHHLVEGADYSKKGLFGKDSKPSLLKPGGEKIMSILGCRPEYVILTETEDFDKPLFYYKFRCQMIHIRTAQIWGDGIGSCNSKEKRYTWDKWKKAERPFEFSDVNTIQKMAQKRAMIQAVLTLGRLSNLFTQDIEDYAGHPNAEKPKTQTADPNKLTTKQRQTLKDWSETYPFVKEELAGKPWKEITRDLYLEITDKVKIIEKEFSDSQEGNDTEQIDDDIPF